MDIDIDKINNVSHRWLDLIYVLIVLSKDGCTALYIACLHGHESIVRLLAERGSNIEAKDRVNDISFSMFFVADES